MTDSHPVTYYTPFTRYAWADSVRAVTCVAAIVAALLVLLVAYRRGREDRRSAALFLVSVALGMGVVIGDSIVALGRPPVWWLTVLRVVAVALAYAASLLVPGEAKRGVWAQRVS